jgi:hypothetical protein
MVELGEVSLLEGARICFPVLMQPELTQRSFYYVQIIMGNNQIFLSYYGAPPPISTIFMFLNLYLKIPIYNKESNANYPMN